MLATAHDLGSKNKTSFAGLTVLIAKLAWRTSTFTRLVAQKAS
jgi:hypothetical protein